MAFAAKRARSWVWFVDGKEQPVATPEVGPIAVAGDRVAYATKRLDGWRMVVDGQVGPPFDKLFQITFSPDGSRLAYLGLRKWRMIAVIDGKEEPVRDAVEGLRFSADSKRVAYLALDTAKRVTAQVVVDGEPGRAYPALLQNLQDSLPPAVRGALGTAFGFVGPDVWRSPSLLPLLTGASAPQFRSDGKVIYAAWATTVAHGVDIDKRGDVIVIAKGQEGLWVEGSDRPLFEASFVTEPVLSEVGDHVGWVEWDGSVERVDKDKDANGVPLCAAVRLYEDGTALDIEFHGAPTDLAKWFDRDKENLFPGTWTLEGDDLTVVVSTGFAETRRAGQLGAGGWQVSDKVTFTFAPIVFVRSKPPLGGNRRPYFVGHGESAMKFDYDGAGNLRGINHELEVQGRDPDGDALQYTWTSSNGTLAPHGPKVVWQRPLERGRPLPGEISVEVTDSKGAKVSSKQLMK